jgi:hypothetical protein
MRILISYDSKTTGSKELRWDHIHNVYPHMSGPLTKIGEYVRAYDSKGKFKEPIFDGYLAGIALLSTEEFDTNFHYVRTQFADVERPSSTESGLVTNYLDETVSRAALPLPYSTTHHVFLLGPMSPSCVEYVNTLTGDVIFHVQGEANGERKTTTYPDAMTVHQNVFPTAFNHWTGEEEMRKIRATIDQSYTVKCLPTIPQTMTTIKTHELVEKDVEIPSIYLSIRVKMLALMKGDAYAFTALPILGICQDMIDKDNSVSCEMLITHSTIVPRLILIGRRVYEAEVSTGYTFTAMNTEGEVFFPKTEAKQVFHLEKTMLNHCRAVIGFKRLLTGEYYYTDCSEKDIVDGVEETSKSERAPFFEPFICKVGFFTTAL